MGLSLFSRLPGLTALAFAAFAFPAVSWAQQSNATPGTVKSNHGAWSIVCDQPAGASAEQCALLEDELLKTFRAGATATFIVFQSPEEGIGIPVDLKGFDEGYDALP
ncbi:hypothetical protein BMJ22_05940 [Sinorhizobium medicae]|nr:hypothetical protein BMJ22_05940 [Sinorhizobium medicae]